MNSDLRKVLLNLVDIITEEAASNPAFRKKLVSTLQELSAECPRSKGEKKSTSEDRSVKNEPITKTSLRRLKISELRDMAETYSIPLKSGEKKDAIIDKILSSIDNVSSKANMPTMEGKKNTNSSHSSASDKNLPNPVEIYYKEGEEKLTEIMNTLEIDDLKLIIRNHRLDTANKSVKWKDKEKLVNMIVQKAKSRATKGNVFLNYVD